MQKISPGASRLGWIGTGVMGCWMCEHLINAGYAMTVFNRSPEKADKLVAKGAMLAPTPKAVAEASDVVFTIVGYPSDVKSVILGEEGVLKGMEPGGVVVDMTTSTPSLAREIAKHAATRQIHAIDAPVSGGDVGARDARLSIMIGGEPDVVDALMPAWVVMGKTITYVGDAGSGQDTKMVNQIAISSGMIAMCEALVYGKRAGLDLNTVLQAISQGAAGSWSLSNYGPRIIAGDYSAGFFIKHFVKDLKIALDEAKKMNLTLPGCQLAYDLYHELAEEGQGELGTQALMLAIEKLNS